MIENIILALMIWTAVNSTTLILMSLVLIWDNARLARRLRYDAT